MGDLLLGYGAVLNDTSAAVRAANKTALVNALAAEKDVYLSRPGTLYLPANAQVDIPASTQLRGCGQWGGTTLSGDGGLLTITHTGDSRSMSDIFLTNETAAGAGILVDVNISAPLGKVLFQNVQMGLAQHHVYQRANVGSFLVDWEFLNCKFQSSIYDSRYFAACSAFKDIGCYSGYNLRHIRFGDSGAAGTIQSVSLRDSVYEYSQNEGIFVIADGMTIDNINLSGCHIEGNGSAGTYASIYLQAQTAGSTIRLVNADGCLFVGSNASTHISQGVSNGGNVGVVKVSSAVVAGTENLAQNLSNVYVGPFNVYRGGNSVQANWKKAQYA